MAHVAKGYSVTKRTGTTSVYRGGKRVGEHPAAGYQVIVKGRGTRLAGTLVAAHALGEMEMDVQPHRRRFVLSAEECDEHEAVLRRNLDDLMKRFPFIPEEAASVDEDRRRHADVIAKGAANVRRALMNVSPYQNVIWNPRALKRPDLDEPESDHPSPAM